VLALAAGHIDAKPTYGRDDEKNLEFIGFLTFLDRPKEGVSETLSELADLGVSVKVITGDNALVSAAVFGFVPLPAALVVAIAAIATLYVVATELLKASFYRNRMLTS